MDAAVWIIFAVAIGVVAALVVVAWEDRTGRAARRHLGRRRLEAEERSELLRRWHEIEADFEEAPSLAVAEAHDLVHLALLERGYPIPPDPEERPEIVSVDHPDLADEYRLANQAHLRAKQGVVPDDHLEHALVSYRSLLGELLATGSPSR